MLLDKIKIKELIVSLLAVLLVLSLTCCSAFNNKYNELPIDIQGKLLIRGYMVSGSMNIFWVVDLATKNIDQLFDEDLINLLNLKYMSFSKYNLDEQKVRHHNNLVYKSPEIIFSSDFNQDLFNLIIEPRIRPLISLENDYIVSFNYQYKVIPDYKYRKLRVIDLKENKEYVKTFDNNIFGFAFSPDNKHLAFFEHQPFAFSDGSVYDLRFLNLATTEVFKINKGQVSLPGSIIWLENLP